MSRGKFIVFEGIDGSGKGTQAKRAVSYIFNLDKENDVLLTREPTRDFKEIRAKLAAATDARKDGEWYLEMFVKDRINHVNKYVLPNLNNGTQVISDRYKHSTLTYQPTQGVPIEKVIEAHKNLPIPDLTIIVDCPAEVAFERRKAEGATDAVEKDVGFQEELRNAYFALPKLLPKEKIVIVNGVLKPELVFESVKKELNSLLLYKK